MQKPPHPHASDAYRCSGDAVAKLRFVNLPTRPPGTVPTMDASDYRTRLLLRLAPDRAVGAAV